MHVQLGASVQRDKNLTAEDLFGCAGHTHRAMPDGKTAPPSLTITARPDQDGPSSLTARSSMKARSSAVSVWGRQAREERMGGNASLSNIYGE